MLCCGFVAPTLSRSCHRSYRSRAYCPGSSAIYSLPTSRRLFRKRFKFEERTGRGVPRPPSHTRLFRLVRSMRMVYLLPFEVCCSWAGCPLLLRKGRRTAGDASSSPSFDCGNSTPSSETPLEIGIFDVLSGDDGTWAGSRPLLLSSLDLLFRDNGRTEGRREGEGGRGTDVQGIDMSWGARGGVRPSRTMCCVTWRAYAGPFTGGRSHVLATLPLFKLLFRLRGPLPLHLPGFPVLESLLHEPKLPDPVARGCG